MILNIKINKLKIHYMNAIAEIGIKIKMTAVKEETSI